MIIVRIAVYTSAYVALNFELLSVGIRANGTLKRRRKNISKRSVIRVLHDIILSFTKFCPLYIYFFFRNFVNSGIQEKHEIRWEGGGAIALRRLLLKICHWYTCSSYIQNDKSPNKPVIIIYSKRKCIEWIFKKKPRPVCGDVVGLHKTIYGLQTSNGFSNSRHSSWRWL